MPVWIVESRKYEKAVGRRRNATSRGRAAAAESAGRGRDPRSSRRRGRRRAPTTFPRWSGTCSRGGSRWQRRSAAEKAAEEAAARQAADAEEKEAAAKAAAAAPVELTLPELKTATGSFSRQRSIGQGGCGIVYKADALPSLPHAGPVAVKKLGAGSYGTVYKCTHVETARQFALKVFVTAQVLHHKNLW